MKKTVLIFSVLVALLLMIGFAPKIFALEEDDAILYVNWPVLNPNSMNIFEKGGSTYQILYKGDKYFLRDLSTLNPNSNWTSGTNLSDGSTMTGIILPNDPRTVTTFWEKNQLYQTAIKANIWYSRVVDNPWRWTGSMFTGEAISNDLNCQIPLPNVVDSISAYPSDINNLKGGDASVMIISGNYYWIKSRNSSKIWSKCGFVINPVGYTTNGFDTHLRFVYKNKLKDIFLKDGKYYKADVSTSNLNRNYLYDISELEIGRVSISNSANLKYGIAVGTWNYFDLKCYDFKTGNEIDCVNDPYRLNIPTISDNWFNFMTPNKIYQLSKGAYNLADFNDRDPNANIQFVWYHYINLGNTFTIPQNGDPYKDRPGNIISSWSSDPSALKNDLINLRAYLITGAPGSVSVYSQKEIQSDGSVIYRNRLPAIEEKTSTQDGNLYKYCNGCIFREQEFKTFLEEASMTTQQYIQIIPEVEYSNNPSHYLEPWEYAAVVNEYSSKINLWFGSSPNKPRLILASPIQISDPKGYETYYTKLYKSGSSNLPLLTSEAKALIAFNSLDFFPDFMVSNPNAYDAKVTEKEIETAVCKDVNKVKAAADFFYSLNNKKTIVTQTAPWICGYEGYNNSTTNYNKNYCAWISNFYDKNTGNYKDLDNIVYDKTKFTAARLIQLTYSQFERIGNLQAWTYWGNIKQSLYSVLPYFDGQFGGLNHGFYSLSNPVNNMAQSNVIGDVYLNLANNNKDYLPESAPSWWLRGTATDFCDFNISSNGDLDGDGHVNIYDYNLLVSKFGNPYTIFDYNDLVANFGK